MSSSEHIVDPPIVDLLHVDDEQGAFVVTFVPSDDLSNELKLVVRIPADSVEGREIQTWLSEFSELFSAEPVRKIVHSGGGEFAFTFGLDDVHTLSTLNNNVVQRVYDGLQYLSQAAENAYRIVRLNLSQSA